MAAGASAGSAYVTLLPSLKGFSGRLNGELGPAATKAGASAGRKAGGTFKSSFAGGLKGIAALTAGVFAFGAAKAFIGDAISASSDLSESASKVNVVFGKQAGIINATAKTSASAMGLSQQAYLESAGTLGNLLVALKVAPDKAATMSASMVKLAGDLASFNNTSPQDALDALRSGLTGETEPLKRYGVNINDALLHQQALKMGLIKTIKGGLTPQNKALATQALIFDQTKKSQGDFARTSGGLANQQRILAAQVVNVKAKLGAFLLPIMISIVKFVTNTVIPAFNKLGPIFQKYLPIAIAYLRNAWAKMQPDIQRLQGYIEKLQAVFVAKLLPIIMRVWAFIKANLKPILIGLGIAFALITAPITSVVAGLIFAYVHFQAVRTAVANVIAAFKVFVAYVQVNVLPVILQIVAYVSVQFGHLVAFVQAHWAAIREAIGHVLVAIQVTVQTVLSTIVGFWHLFGDRIIAVVLIAFNLIKTTVSNIIRAIRDIINIVLDLINGDWGKAWAAVKDLVATVLDEVKAIVKAALGLVVQEIKAALTLAKLAFTTAWDGIKSFMSGALDALVGMFSSLGSTISGAVSGTFDGLKNAFRSAINFIIDGWNSLHFGIPTFDTHIPGIGKVGGGSVGTPHIPRLAAGGIVTKATLAMIGEGNEPEAVVPLSKLTGLGAHVTIENHGRDVTPATVVQGLHQWHVMNGGALLAGSGLGGF